MTDYQIVSEGSVAELEHTVNHYLRDGWRLAGGVSAMVEAGTPWFFQAVYKEPPVMSGYYQKDDAGNWVPCDPLNNRVFIDGEWRTPTHPTSTEGV